MKVSDQKTICKHCGQQIMNGYNSSWVTASGPHKFRVTCYDFNKLETYPECHVLQRHEPIDVRSSASLLVM